MNRAFLALTVSAFAAAACGDRTGSASAEAATGGTPLASTLEIDAGQPFPDVDAEVHLRNVRQLTFDGENAEGYFSFDGTRLVYQRTTPEGGCDQIHSLDLATGGTRLVSTGEGRTTCSYYYPDGRRILFSSTHHHDAACPARPDYSRGYVWPVYATFDIFVAGAEGRELLQLTDTPGYDAEATFSPRGDRIVFTSMRSGDLDIWTMAPDGTDLRQVTSRVGYDGGAFFSPDGSKIVWRAHYPRTEEESKDYQALLADGLIRPSTLEIWIADADGGNARQLTHNGAANFGPFWHPSGEKVLFASNVDDPTGRDFDIYMVGVDGTGLERVTFTGDFDGFPVFSPDGRFLVWGSNRNPAHEGNTNLFIAEWVEG